MDKGRRLLKLLLIPSLLGLAVSLVLYLLLNTQQTPVQAAPIEMVGVVAAKGDIPSRVVLNDSMLQVRQVPKNLVGTYEIRDLKKALGQVTTVPLTDGEAVLTTKLADQNQGLAYQVPKGKRAVTLRVDEFSGVAGYPAVGDSIDLILSYQGGKDKAAGAQARLLLQNVTILAKGVAAPPATGTKVAPPEAKVPTSYTLAVTPQQAVQLTLAEDISRVKFVLRPATDEGTEVPSILTDASLLGLPAVPAPAPAPASSPKP